MLPKKDSPRISEGLVKNTANVDVKRTGIALSQYEKNFTGLDDAIKSFKCLSSSLFQRFVMECLRIIL